MSSGHNDEPNPAVPSMRKAMQLIIMIDAAAAVHHEREEGKKGMLLSVVPFFPSFRLSVESADRTRLVVSIVLVRRLDPRPS